MILTKKPDYLLLLLYSKGFTESSFTLKDYTILAEGFPNGLNKDEPVIVSFCCKFDDMNMVSHVLPQQFPFVLIKVGNPI